jgi:hypothetical protein
MIEHLTKVKNILMIPKAYLRDKKTHNTKVVRDIVLFLMMAMTTKRVIEMVARVMVTGWQQMMATAMAS